MRNQTATRHPLIAAIIASLLILFMFTSVGNYTAIADTSKDWIFYGQFVQQAGEIHYEVKPDTPDNYENFSEAEPDIQGVFEAVKDQLRNELGNYTDMCWDRFDQTQLKVCDLKEFDLVRNTVLAFYHTESNTVYCLRDKLQALQDSGNSNRVLELLAHELIHALTLNDANKESIIIEGFTEYLAQSIFPTGTAPSYYYHYAFIDTLVKDVGIDVAMEAFLNGTIDELIDRAIGQSGAIYNIQGPLSNTATGLSTDDQELIVLDVYAHYLQATHIDDEDTRNTFNVMLKQLNSVPKAIAAKVYFEEILPFSLTATTS